MTLNDPWAVLGLAPGASVAEARAARRRLAKQLHPDLAAGRPAADSAAGEARLARVNWALAEIEAPLPAAPAAAPASPAAAGDAGTFSVDWLPAEAFEVLFLAAYGLGDILAYDEPYLLEVFLPEPSPCFCSLTLAPEAGGSEVTVEVHPAADHLETPVPDAVIAVLIRELQALAPS